MNLIALSAKGWKKSPKVVKSILTELARKKVISTIIIDFKEVTSNLNNHDFNDNNFAVFNINDSEENLSANARSFSEVSFTKLTSFAKNLSTDKIILIDATGSSIDKIYIILDNARRIWFHLDGWQPIFAIIADDYELVKVSEKLSTTFYLMPEIISNQEVQKWIKKIQLRAKLLKFFGPGKILNILNMVRDKKIRIKNYFGI